MIGTGERSRSISSVSRSRSSIVPDGGLWGSVVVKRAYVISSGEMSMPLHVSGTPRRSVTMIGKLTRSTNPRNTRCTSSSWEAGSVDAAANRATRSVRVAV
jgi:hypothetical protein